MPDAQSVCLSEALLRRGSSEDERLAKLALISSLRKRLCSLPGETAADVEWRVRLRVIASAARNRLLPVCESRGIPCSRQAPVHAAGRLQGRPPYLCGSCSVGRAAAAGIKR